nr:Methionine--tRNA ligase [Cupriavidus sp.]
MPSTLPPSALNPAARVIFLTSALPYANGAIHLGHLVEYIQTDIWARFQRLRGHEVVYICADDTHGTPIMLRAEKEGISPEALIERVWQEHTRDFAAFGIQFDRYYSTHSEENRQLSEQIYQALKDQGLIEVREIAQMYDPVREMFLPDRFIKGDCPKCGAKDQYGDSCEACGATYAPTDLKNPVSAVSGAQPITRQSAHHFFRLSDPRCVSFLREWALESGRLQPEAANKLKEWLGESSPRATHANQAGGATALSATAAPQSEEPGQASLGDWDISRDAPYFGFEIPGAPGKYFYVWLDAPIGYYAGLKKWCAENHRDFAEFVNPESEAEQVHFIGKDILYFHTLFWPAMLHFSGHRTPTRVFAHGFLTVDGAKMSKSRGTFITAQSYSDQKLNPEWLRYYFASKLNGSLEDLDLNFNDFIAKVNSDLVGKFANIASRSAGFVVRHFNGRLLQDARLLAPGSAHAGLEERLAYSADSLAQAYEDRDTARLVRELTALMDAVNEYVDAYKPWELAKKLPDSEAAQTLHRVGSTTLRCFARLCAAVAPILPATTDRALAEVFGRSNGWRWKEIDMPEVSQVLPFSHLMARVDRAQIDSLIAANRS